MTYVLIDNATLTGVQRLVGQVPTRSTRAVEGDIGALENLVEAILLYDDIVAIDDYKPEFQAERHASFPFVRFLDPQQFGIPSVIQAAEVQARSVRPEVHGGDFVDADFKAFFTALRTHVICEWNLQGSVFHLTMRLLGEARGDEFEKYGALSQAIFSELSDSADAGRTVAPAARLVDSRGNLIGADYRLQDGSDTGGVSPALKAFLASLNWLAHRTIFYALAAEHLRGDVALYPTRQVYHRHYMETTGRLDGTFVADITKRLAEGTRSTVDSVITANRAVGLSLTLPLFSAWLVHQTGDVREVVNAALQLRHDPRVAQTREQLKELRMLFDADDVEEASRKVQAVVRELEKGLDEVRAAFGLKMQQVITWASVLKIYNAVKPGGLPGLPEAGQDNPVLPEFMRRWRQKGIGALYRDVGRDLAAFPKLGRIRDLLGSGIVLDGGAISATPKAADPRYRYAHLSWKRPM